MSLQFVSIHVIPFINVHAFSHQIYKTSSVQLADGHTSLKVCTLLAHAAAKAHREPNFLHNRRTFFTDSLCYPEPVNLYSPRTMTAMFRTPQLVRNIFPFHAEHSVSHIDSLSHYFTCAFHDFSF